MAVETYPAFLQNEAVTAAQTRRAIHAVLARGSTPGSAAGGIIGATDCVVAQNGTPNMSVNTAVGEAYVPGTSSSVQSAYYLYVSTQTNTGIATAPSSNSRIDLICATVNDTAYGAGSDSGVIQAVTGTVSGSPVAPSLPATSTPLADIAVGTNVTSIVTANITDARVFSVIGIGLWNTRKISGSGTVTMSPGDHVIVSSGSPTLTLPQPALNSRWKTTCQGSGSLTVSHYSAEKIYGKGLGSTGGTSFPLGGYGSTTTGDSDGTSQFITAGALDTGWVAITAASNVSSSAYARQIGNRVQCKGGLTSTGSITSGAGVATLPSAISGKPGGGYGFTSYPTTTAVQFALDASTPSNIVTESNIGSGDTWYLDAWTWLVD